MVNTLLLTLLLLSFGSTSRASTNHQLRQPASASGGEFSFVYRPIHGIKLPEHAGKNPKLELRIRADSYEEAFKAASKECFRHFKNGQKLSENDGLSIIDVCANPRDS